MISRRYVLPAVAVLSMVAWQAFAQTAGGGAGRLVLQGYDPVAYFTEGKPIEGKVEHETKFDGARYRFVSQKHLELFNIDPDKYAPQFSGACTNGVSRGMKVEANPALWKIVDNKLYVFWGRVPDGMDANPAGIISKAEENWKALAAKPF